MDSCEVADLTDELQRAVTRIYRRVQAELPHRQLPNTQRYVLRHLIKDGPATARALSDRERISQPAMTQTINALQAAGLVTRSPDPSDGRKLLVSATDAAHELNSTSQRVKHAWLHERLSELSDDELQALDIARRVFDTMADS
ncbi:MarR family winged helix-turn-helix transcriptional regulator [Streptomyces sp. NPDC091272]|uniref:MarR family winged helix-turn-helix transcriptional regulator n=1 Tax=Streptomyces sp. NPDC091272 TaxID=3365981 RepID=UPI0037F11A2C